MRILSYESDVLRALADLSSSIATTHGWTYYAGIRKGDLQIDLRWCVTGLDYTNANFKVFGKVTPPSWSLISQRGRKIYFTGREIDHQVVNHNESSLLLKHSLDLNL